VAPTAGGDAPFTNFSYALQWLTFGVIALVALGYFVRLELLQRRGGDRRADRAALRRALAGEDEPGTH
jgi:cytochrome oxidase assembly protein ShyY1